MMGFIRATQSGCFAVCIASLIETSPGRAAAGVSPASIIEGIAESSPRMTTSTARDITALAFFAIRLQTKAYFSARPNEKAVHKGLLAGYQQGAKQATAGSGPG